MLCWSSGQNVLHVLGQFGKENAAAIFDLMMEHRPQLPVDQLDANGNTGVSDHIYTTHYSSCLTATATHMSRHTQCYLPPGGADIPAATGSVGHFFLHITVKIIFIFQWHPASSLLPHFISRRSWAVSLS